jgi:hypothetical protein
MRLPRSISSIRVALKLQGVTFVRVRNTSQITEEDHTHKKEEVHSSHNNIVSNRWCDNTVKFDLKSVQLKMFVLQTFAISEH